MPRDIGSARQAKTLRTHDYTDEDGNVLYQVVRKEPKAYPQRRPDPDNSGQWLWGVKDVRRVIYNLPNILQAIAAKQVVYIVGGEKDADQMGTLGIVATCNAGGPGKWRNDLAEPLRGAHVTIIATNDDAGLAHARQVLESIQGVTAQVSACVCQGGRTVSEALSIGMSLSFIIGEPLGVDDDEPPADPISAQLSHLTDVGNGKRFVRDHGEIVRYVHAWKSWIVWDQTRWQRDDSGKAIELAKATARSICNEAVAEEQEAQRKAIIKWSFSTEAATRLKAMMQLAQSELGMPIDPSVLDADLWVINCCNGTLDLKTGQVRPHRKEDMLTKLAPVDYDSFAMVEGWTEDSEAAKARLESFLVATLPDTEVRNFVQRAAGYSLLGEPREEVLFLIHGPTNSGKSTFLEMVKACMGEYARTADFSSFLVNRSGDQQRPRSDLARLAGTRFVSSSEVSDGSSLAVGIVKNLTGGETITARYQHQSEFEYLPQFTLWLAANDQPRVPEGDEAFWRRIYEVPFLHTVLKADRDPEVKRYLCSPEAAPIVMAWLVDGLQEYLRDGLNVPEAVMIATEFYRQSMNPLAQWLEECVILGVEKIATTDALYASWKDYVQLSRPMTKQTFGKKVAALTGVSFRWINRKRGYLGIGLIENVSAPAVDESKGDEVPF